MKKSPTKASEFPEGIFVERPEGMDYELYKTLRKMNKKKVDVYISRGVKSRTRVPQSAKMTAKVPRQSMANQFMASEPPKEIKEEILPGEPPVKVVWFKRFIIWVNLLRKSILDRFTS